MPNTVDSIGDEAMLDQIVSDDIESIEDDRVLSVRPYAFAYADQLKTVRLPNCTSTSSSAWYSDTNLEEVWLDSCDDVDRESFAYCENLRVVSLRNLYSKTSVTGDFAPHCPNLKHLVITSNKVSKRSTYLYPPGAMICGEGIVYVHEHLLDSYRNDPYWGAYSYRAISEYPAVPEDTISDSWAQIAAASASGAYSTKYKVGDTKSMEIDGTTYRFALAAMDEDDLASGGKAHMTWIMNRRAYNTTHQMVDDASAMAGGWEHSSMRSWLSSTILPLMPSDVRNSVKPVLKTSRVVGATTTDAVTTDTLWIPSAHEVFGGVEGSGPTYSQHFGTNTRRTAVSQGSDLGFSKCSWWLRSMYDDTVWRHVSYVYNSLDWSSPTYRYGVVMGFCM